MNMAMAESKYANPGASEYARIRDPWEKGLAVLQPTDAQLEHGLELHRQSIVMDTFSFLPMAVNERLKQEWNDLVEAGVGGNDFHFRNGIYRRVAPTYDESSGREFLEAITCSGLTGMVHTSAEGKTLEEDITRIAASIHTCGHFDPKVRQLRSPGDVVAAHEQQAFCVALSVNGPPCPARLNDLDEELRWLDTWYHLGVRLMHLSYNRRNVIATGCAEAHDGGLSDLGYDLVRALNRVGIVVDVPHSSELTCLQAAATSSKPIMASHVGCKEVFDHIRGKSDKVLKAIAGTGGLVGIVALPTFLGKNANIHTLLDHVDHAVSVIGSEHVSIGTDYTYSPPVPEEWLKRPQSAFRPQWWGAWDMQRDLGAGTDENRSGSLAWTNWPLFTVGLVMRGYCDEDIQNILGRNLLRILEQNQPDGLPSTMPLRQQVERYPLM